MGHGRSPGRFTNIRVIRAKAPFRAPRSGFMEPRPSRRREGHATEMLRLTLLEARKRRMERVLLTCDTENEPSVKTILNNGGQFDSEEYVDVHGGLIARYWISL